MKITIILCTYNRCNALPKALQSVVVSAVPESDEWDIIVVDNNSNDRTREVVEEFSIKYPGRFHYIFESTPGKSHALNAGIRAARGDVLAFMDDDEVVTPTWLQNLTAPLHDGAWGGSGGPVVLEWACERPTWLPRTGRYALAALAAFNFGSEAGPLPDPPFGSNMAFRKEMFTKYGNFRTDLGPSPNKKVPRPNEDTEFGSRLLAAGERLRYEPSAVVYHPVPQERVRKQYFLNWHFDKGRAEVRTEGIPTGSGASIAGVPLHLFRRIVVGVARWMVAVEPYRRFEYKCRVWGLAGLISESYRMSHENRSGRPKEELRSKA